jgi:hypothetical protein
MIPWRRTRNEFREEARDKILRGVDILADAVAVPWPKGEKS